MSWLANETGVAEVPAPHGAAFAPDDPEAVPDVVPDMVPAPDAVPVPDVVPEAVPDIELPPVLEPVPLEPPPPEQPTAEVTEAIVAKERMIEIAPRIGTVLSSLP